MKYASSMNSRIRVSCTYRTDFHGVLTSYIGKVGLVSRGMADMNLYCLWIVANASRWNLFRLGTISILKTKNASNTCDVGNSPTYDQPFLCVVFRIRNVSHEFDDNSDSFRIGYIYELNLRIQFTCTLQTTQMMICHQAFHRCVPYTLLLSIIRVFTSRTKHSINFSFLEVPAM